MLQDDRVMSILTGIVIVVTMATLAQRSDELMAYFLNEKPATITPQNDEATVVAGAPRVIDVLGNDQNVIEEDPDNLNIVVSPSCGAAETTAGGVLYLSNDGCVGQQLFAYCVKRGDECVPASVTVNVVAAGTPIPEEPERATGGLVAASPERIEAAPAQRVQPKPAAAPAPEPDPEPRARSADAASGAAAGDDDRLVIAALPPTQKIAPPQPDRAPSFGDVDAAAPPPEPELSDEEPVVALAAASLAPTRLAAASPAHAGADLRFQSVIAQPGLPPAPALSAIEVAPDPIELASLPAPEGSSRDRAKAEEAEQAVTRRQRPGDADADADADANADGDLAAEAATGGACPDPTILTRAQIGGRSEVSVSDPCRPSAAIVLRHAGLDFGARLDANGETRIALPVLDAGAGAVLATPDGREYPVELSFNERDLAYTHRVAVAWSSPVNLDLHAFEYAAPFGGDGHVWEQNPRRFSEVRRPGGGYLTSFPPATADGQSIEVYTFWAARRARPGFMRIVLDHASRGDVPTGEFCGAGALASPDYVIVRSSEGELTRRAEGRFAAAPCGEALGSLARYANSALEDLRIQAR